MFDCKYGNIEYFKELSGPFRIKSHSLNDINICYLRKL